MKQLLFILTILLTLPALCAAREPHVNERVKYKQGPSFIYRLYLTDKKGSPYSLNHPGRYLSRRSIERRKRQQLRLFEPVQEFRRLSNRQDNRRRNIFHDAILRR